MRWNMGTVSGKIHSRIRLRVGLGLTIIKDVTTEIKYVITSRYCIYK